MTNLENGDSINPDDVKDKSWLEGKKRASEYFVEKEPLDGKINPAGKTREYLVDEQGEEIDDVPESERDALYQIEEVDED